MGIARGLRKKLAVRGPTRQKFFGWGKKSTMNFKKGYSLTNLAGRLTLKGCILSEKIQARPYSTRNRFGIGAPESGTGAKVEKNAIRRND